MTMENKKFWGGIVAVVVIAVLAAWYYADRGPEPFPASASDHISSWSLMLPQDIASTSPKINADITKLKGMLGKGQYGDDDIYIGIANDQILLGDGKAAYDSYQRAITASSTNALAYADLGALFQRLHATSSAERAYAKAAELQPTQALFQLTYLNFLTQVDATASSTAAAFISAKTALGTGSADFLITEAQWLGKISSTTAAIADWRAVEALEPGQTAAIEAQIAKLKQQ